MRKYIVIVFVMLLAVIGCKKDTEPTKSENTSIINGTQIFSADEQGYDFSEKKLINMKNVPDPGWASRPDLVSQIDVGWSDRYICASPYVNASTVSGSDIIDMGLVDFNSITEAPSSGYLKNWIKPIVNHVYCLKTQDLKYAKIKVVSIDSSARSLTFDYLLQTDGTRIIK